MVDMCKCSRCLNVAVTGFLVAALASLAPAGPGSASIVINEFMAANGNVIADGQQEFDDWIELYNAGSQPVNVGGMYLTDDLAIPTKWRIPSGNPALTTVAPGRFLLIWADGDIGDPGLHAAFSLDAAGEEIALFDSDGVTLIDYVAFKDHVGNVSYGRFPDGIGDWAFLTAATPGASNPGAYEDVVDDTKFSHDRGFRSEPFEVTITCTTPGAVIYYTLDGSEPSDIPGKSPSTRVYSGPIPITNTTCLRARAFRSGWLPSNVDTQTYLFLNDVIRRTQAQVVAQGYPSKWYGNYAADYEMDPQIYNDPAYAGRIIDAMLAIPTLSIVTDKGHFFSLENHPDRGGIYIYTGHPTTGGQDWERPISIELFTADESREFHANCGVRIQGGEGRRPNKCPKHSLGLRFRSEYGPSALEFPLYEGSPVDAFDTLQLRGFFNNAWTHWDAGQRQRAQYIRDQWMRDSLLDMGHVDAGRGFYVHLYINGMYWGLYNLQERPVASHYAAYRGGDEERIDAINGGRATDGTTQAWSQTRSIAASRNWAAIEQAIDVDNFIDWTLLCLFAGNIDLKTDGNWRAAGGGPDRRPWRFYSWDAERILENPNQNGTSPSADPTGLFNHLNSIEEFRIRFGDRVHKHLFNGGALTPERNAQRWIRRAGEIDLAVIAESARWGDYRRDVHPYSSGPYLLYTRDAFWVPEKNRLLNDYFPRRTAIALDQFKSRGLYPGVDAPVFHVNGSYQHGGHTPTGGLLSMPASTGTIWCTFDGSDPRMAGGTGGQGSERMLVPEAAAKRVLVPTGPIGNTWRSDRTFNDSAWISGTGGVGYERGSGYESLFKIDVHNAMYGKNTTCYVRIPFSVSAADLTGASGLFLKVRYDDGFVAYLNGTEIARKNFAGEPAWNSAAGAVHTDVEAVNFEVFDVTAHTSALHLNENLLAIQVMNDGTTSSDFLISVELSVGASAPGGVQSGVSPAAQRYTMPIPLQASVQVKARTLSGSVWSALNEAVFAVGPVAESLRISEIMYHPADTGNPDDPNTEYVELTNIGAAAIDLNFVKFTRGIDFTFPSFSLAPGGYCLVVKDVEAFEGRYGLDLPVVGQYAGSLSNGGERIELIDAAGRAIHDFRYEDDWYKATDSDDFSLTLKDPATADPNALGDESLWRPSDDVGGSPSRAE